MGRRWVQSLAAGLVLLLAGLAVWGTQSPVGELFVLNLLGRRAAYITDGDGRVVAILPRNLPHHIAPVDRSGQLDNLDGILDMLAALAATGDPDDLRTALDFVPLAGPEPGTVWAMVTVPTEHLDTVVRTLEERGIAVPAEPLAAKGQSFFEVALPLGLLADIARVEPTAYFAAVIPPEPLHHDVPQRYTAAPIIHGVEAWDRANYTGQGVTVGVIDVGFALYLEMQKEREVPIPAGVRCLDNTGQVLRLDNTEQVLNNLADLADCDKNPRPPQPHVPQPHGTAVVEALMDIAPDASILVAEVSSPYSLEKAVAWMIEHDVDIINMSVGFPWDGDGSGDPNYAGLPKAGPSPLKTVDMAVKAGITWVNGAGNSNQHVWSGPLKRAGRLSGFGLWVDGLGSLVDKRFFPVLDRIRQRDRGYEEKSWYRDRHQFDHVFGRSNSFLAGNTCNPIRGNDQRVWIQLRWDDTWGGATRDLNIELYDALGNNIALSSRDWFPLYPIETYDTPKLDRGWYCLQIHDHSAAEREVAHEPAWVQLQVNHRGPPLTYSSGVGSIGNPAESRNDGVLAVGAAEFGPPLYSPEIARYSSRGHPSGLWWPAPAIVGIAGDYSHTYQDAIGRNTFGGTSAAAPHVAGLAALVKQRFPDMGPVEIANYLRDNAEPRSPAHVWGHGLARLPPPDTPAADLLPTPDTQMVQIPVPNPTQTLRGRAQGLWQGLWPGGDKQVLLDIRDQLRGANTDVLTTWNAGTPLADFEGVSVDGNPPKVVALIWPPRSELTDADAKGAYTVDSTAALMGSLPPDLGKLDQLRYLVFAGHQLTGPIPPELGQIQYLEWLDLYGNQLNGPIPPELGQLHNLRRLFLDDNQLSGPIPSEFGQLHNLERLDLDNNQLTGCVPRNLRYIDTLWIDRNVTIC